MKPRLDSAPWTEEDKVIIGFSLGVHRSRDGYNFYDKMSVYVESDRRDADLMLHAQMGRIGHWGWLWCVSVPGGAYQPAGAWFGGPLPSSQAINRIAADNITNFA